MFVFAIIVVLPSIARSHSLAVVGLEGCQQPSTAANVRLIRDALSRVSAEVQPADVTIGTLGGSISDASPADILRSFLQAKTELDQGQPGASETLAGTMRTLLASPPSASRCQLIQDAFLMWSSALFRLNKKADAKAFIEKVMRVKSFSPDPRQYPPWFVKFVNSVKAESAKGATASLSIQTAPAGLEVYVDGCPAGVSPVRLRLPPAEYQIDAGFPSGHSLAKKVRVEGETAVELSQDFEGSIYTDSGPCVDFGNDIPRRLSLLGRLASLLGVRSIVTLRDERPAEGERYLVVTLFDSSTSKAREARMRLSPAGIAQGVAAKIAEWVTTGTGIPDVLLGEAPRGATNGESPAPLSSISLSDFRAVAWVLGGLALASGVIAVVEQVSKNDLERRAAALKTPGGSILLSNIDRFRDLQAQATSTAKMRTGFAIGAATAAAAAGSLFVITVRPVLVPARAQSAAPRVGLGVAVLKTF